MTLFDIYSSPGHLIRRSQQILVSLFLEQTKGVITPIQFGVLAVLESQGELDQVTLAQRLALDASTSGSTLERLEKKGWISRRMHEGDRRRRMVSLASDGRALLQELLDDVETIQQRLLDPLDPKERVVFMRLLTKVVHLNNDVSRAPLRIE
ncbi:MarR family winged helix-turn-helix transcriptional regulator [Acidovorax cavernicola]|uniref:MarR family transcriptional regulator n=1 Tax=Acidovorax cavernicola TaxID=1675792 RepID=A0A9X8GW68_9BURK|nr:MarR family transcriptional regulator [Acidovorax cavernicola]RIX83196.1 MarR family transcriptional regulator [Acidovorax cavernicola]